MKKQYTLIVADSSVDFRQALQQQFEPFCRICSCGTGWEVLEQLTRTSPDVLVLDLMLPGLDGLSLLRAISALGICPEILAVSSYVSPYILQMSEQLGVSCLMEKPCSLSQIEGKIRRLLKERNGDTREDRFVRVSGILLQLGFSAKLRGYSYLREAVLRLAEQPELSIIKELYPDIGDSHGVTAEDVEHSIRSAARDAWNHSSRESWELYFSREELGARPSNAALIQVLAETLWESRKLPEALGL